MVLFSVSLIIIYMRCAGPLGLGGFAFDRDSGRVQSLPSAVLEDGGPHLIVRHVGHEPLTQHRAKTTGLAHIGQALDFVNRNLATARPIGDPINQWSKFGSA